MSNLDDRMWATMPSRRSFLQRMGLGVGALGACPSNCLSRD